MKILNVRILCTHYSVVSGSAAGMVISSQISSGFIELPENGTVKLKFNNVSTVCISIVVIRVISTECFTE